MTFRDLVGDSMNKLMEFDNANPAVKDYPELHEARGVIRQSLLQVDLVEFKDEIKPNSLLVMVLGDLVSALIAKTIKGKIESVQDVQVVTGFYVQHILDGVTILCQDELRALKEREKKDGMDQASLMELMLKSKTSTKVTH